VCAERRRRLWRTAPPEPPPDPTAAADLALLRDLVHSLTRAERAEEAFQFALDRTCPDVFADHGLEDWQEVATELGFSALVSLPLVLPQGVAGAVTFYFAEAGSRTSRVRDLLRAVADVMAAMAGQEALRERLRHAEAALELHEQRLEGAPRNADSGQTLE